MNHFYEYRIKYITLYDKYNIIHTYNKTNKNSSSLEGRQIIKWFGRMMWEISWDMKLTK